MKNWFLVGLLAGFGSSLAKSLIAAAAQRLGAPAKRYDSLAGKLMMGRKPEFGGLTGGRLRTTDDRVLGSIADAIAGGAFGVALSYTYAHTPAGNGVVKGALGGAALGAISLAAGRQLGVTGFRDMTAQDAATHLGLSTLLGGLEGMVLGRYASQVGSQAHPALVKEVTERVSHAGPLGYGRVAGARVHRLWRPRKEQPAAGQPARPLDAGLAPTIE